MLIWFIVLTSKNNKSDPPPRINYAGLTLAALMLLGQHLPFLNALAGPGLYARTGAGVSRLPYSVNSFGAPGFGDIDDAVNLANGNVYIDAGEISQNTAYADNRTTSTPPTASPLSTGVTTDNAALNDPKAMLPGKWTLKSRMRIDGLMSLSSTTLTTLPTTLAMAVGDGSRQIFNKTTIPDFTKVPTWIQRYKNTSVGYYVTSTIPGTHTSKQWLVAKVDETVTPRAVTLHYYDENGGRITFKNTAGHDYPLYSQSPHQQFRAAQVGDQDGTNTTFRTSFTYSVTAATPYNPDNVDLTQVKDEWGRTTDYLWMLDGDASTLDEIRYLTDSGTAQQTTKFTYDSSSTELGKILKTLVFSTTSGTNGTATRTFTFGYKLHEYKDTDGGLQKGQLVLSSITRQVQGSTGTKTITSQYTYNPEYMRPTIKTYTSSLEPPINYAFQTGVTFKTLDTSAQSITGDKVTVTQANPADATNTKKIEYYLDDNSQVRKKQVTDYNPVTKASQTLTWVYEYYKTGYLALVGNPEGNFTHYTYDSNGNVNRKSDYSGNPFSAYFQDQSTITLSGKDMVFPGDQVTVNVSVTNPQTAGTIQFSFPAGATNTSTVKNSDTSYTLTYTAGTVEQYTELKAWSQNNPLRITTLKQYVTNDVAGIRIVNTGHTEDRARYQVSDYTYTPIDRYPADIDFAVEVVYKAGKTEVLPASSINWTTTHSNPSLNSSGLPYSYTKSTSTYNGVTYTSDVRITDNQRGVFSNGKYHPYLWFQSVMGMNNVVALKATTTLNGQQFTANYNLGLHYFGVVPADGNYPDRVMGGRGGFGIAYQYAVKFTNKPAYYNPSVIWETNSGIWDNAGNGCLEPPNVSGYWFFGWHSNDVGFTVRARLSDDSYAFEKNVTAYNPGGGYYFNNCDPYRFPGGIDDGSSMPAATPAPSTPITTGIAKQSIPTATTTTVSDFVTELKPGYQTVTYFTYDVDNQLTQTQVTPNTATSVNDGKTVNYQTVVKTNTYTMLTSVTLLGETFTALQKATETTKVGGVTVNRQAEMILDEYGRLQSSTHKWGSNLSEYRTATYTYFTKDEVAAVVVDGNTSTEVNVKQYPDRVKSTTVTASNTPEATPLTSTENFRYNALGMLAYHSLDGLVTSVDATSATPVYTTKSIITQSTFNGYGQQVRKAVYSGSTLLTVTKSTYAQTGELIRSKEGTGKDLTVYQYDDLGRLIKMQHGLSTDGLTVSTVHQDMTYGYDAFGRLTTQKEAGTTEATGVTTLMDTLDRPVQVTTPDGNTTTTEYHLGGQVRKTVTPKITEVNEYDTLGRLIRQSRTQKQGNTTPFIKKFYRDVYNQVLSEVVETSDGMSTNETARTSNYTYNSEGKLMLVTGPTLRSQGDTTSGVVADTRFNMVSYEYDELGRKTKERLLLNGVGTPSTPTSGENALTSFTYNGLGQITSTTDPNGYITRYTYDASGNVIKQERQVWKGTESAGDANIQDATTYAVIHKAYNPLGKVVQEVDATNKSRYTFYNEFGNVVMRKDERGYVLEAYTYTEDGLPLAVYAPKNGAGAALKNITPATISTSTDLQVMKAYEYGNRPYPTAIYSASMDTLPTVSGLTISGGLKTSYTYDFAGRPTTVVSPLGTSISKYDSEGNLSELTDEKGFRTTYLYDAYKHPLEEVQYARSGNAVDTAAKITSLKNTYTYDVYGNLTEREEGGLRTKYVYNSAGQLVAETRPYKAASNPAVYYKKYAYRLDGKKLAETNFAFDGSLNPMTIKATNLPAFKRGNLKLWEFDALGNTTREYSYGAYISNGVTSTLTEKDAKYTYNGLGLRVKRSFTGADFIYAQQRKDDGSFLSNAQSNPDVNYSTYWTYSINGKLLSSWDSNSGNPKFNVFSYQYDDTGLVKEETHDVRSKVLALQRSAEAVAAGQNPSMPSLLLAATVSTTSIVRNERNQVLTSEITDSSPIDIKDVGKTTRQRTTYSYYHDGKPKSITVERGPVTNNVATYSTVGSVSYQYDSQGRLYKLTDGNGALFTGTDGKAVTMDSITADSRDWIQQAGQTTFRKGVTDGKTTSDRNPNQVVNLIGKGKAEITFTYEGSTTIETVRWPENLTSCASGRLQRKRTTTLQGREQTVEIIGCTSEGNSNTTYTYGVDGEVDTTTTVHAIDFGADATPRINFNTTTITTSKDAYGNELRVTSTSVTQIPQFKYSYSVCEPLVEVDEDTGTFEPVINETTGEYETECEARSGTTVARQESETSTVTNTYDPYDGYHTGFKKTTVGSKQEYETVATTSTGNDLLMNADQTLNSTREFQDHFQTQLKGTVEYLTNSRDQNDEATFAFDSRGNRLQQIGGKYDKYIKRYDANDQVSMFFKLDVTDVLRRVTYNEFFYDPEGQLIMASAAGMEQDYRRMSHKVFRDNKATFYVDGKAEWVRKREGGIGQSYSCNGFVSCMLMGLGFSNAGSLQPFDTYTSQDLNKDATFTYVDSVVDKTEWNGVVLFSDPESTKNYLAPGWNISQNTGGKPGSLKAPNGKTEAKPTTQKNTGGASLPSVSQNKLPALSEKPSTSSTQQKDTSKPTPSTTKSSGEGKKVDPSQYKAPQNVLPDAIQNSSVRTLSTQKSTQDPSVPTVSGRDLRPPSNTAPSEPTPDTNTPVVPKTNTGGKGVTFKAPTGQAEMDATIALAGTKMKMSDATRQGFVMGLGSLTDDELKELEDIKKRVGNDPQKFIEEFKKRFNNIKKDMDSILGKYLSTLEADFDKVLKFAATWDRQDVKILFMMSVMHMISGRTLNQYKGYLGYLGIDATHEDIAISFMKSLGNMASVGLSSKSDALKTQVANQMYQMVPNWHTVEVLYNNATRAYWKGMLDYVKQNWKTMLADMVLGDVTRTFAGTDIQGNKVGFWERLGAAVSLAATVIGGVAGLAAKGAFKAEQVNARMAAFLSNMNKTKAMVASEKGLDGAASAGCTLSWMAQLAKAANSFDAKTPVWTKNGLVAIAALTIGTPVLAFDENSGQQGFYPVTKIFINEDPTITALVLKDAETQQYEYLTTTPEHPFYVMERSDSEPRPKPEGHPYLSDRWVGAGHLKIGDKLRQADGTLGEVRYVNTIHQTRTMYNLEVQEAHTFFVGTQGWLAHNATPGDPAVLRSNMLAAGVFDEGSGFTPHHMIPVASGYSKRRGFVRSPLLDIAINAGWDIDAAENGIFLPRAFMDSINSNLPQHPGWNREHKSYNAYVQELIDETYNALNRQYNGRIPADVAKKALYDLQHRLTEELISLGGGVLVQRCG